MRPLRPVTSRRRSELKRDSFGMKRLVAACLLVRGVTPARGRRRQVVEMQACSARVVVLCQQQLDGAGVRMPEDGANAHRVIPPVLLARSERERLDLDDLECAPAEPEDDLRADMAL